MKPIQRIPAPMLILPPPTVVQIHKKAVKDGGPKKITGKSVLKRLMPFLDAFEGNIHLNDADAKSLYAVEDLLKQKGYKEIQSDNDEGDTKTYWAKAYTFNKTTGQKEHSPSIYLDSNFDYSLVILPSWETHEFDEPSASGCLEGLIYTKKEEWTGLGLYEGGRNMSSTELWHHINQNR